MMKPFVPVILLSALVALPASATQYYVDNTNGGASNSNAGTSSSQPWLTIGKAASTLVAGDTVTVGPGGSYDEAVTPTNSGSTGNVITYIAGTGTKPKVRDFVLANKSYITIQGFEITSAGMTSDLNAGVDATGTDHVSILNNYFHDTKNQGVRANPNSGAAKATSLHIKGNTFTNIGPPGSRNTIIECWCDQSLDENNDESHGGDFTHFYGHNNVVRNNSWHDSSEADAGGEHIDGVQSFCTGTNPAAESANYLLIEGNQHFNNPDANSHFVLINSANACGSTTVITRYNQVYNVGSFTYSANDPANITEFFHKIYNNTVSKGTVGTPQHDAFVLSGVTTGTILNNILSDAIVNSAPREGYTLNTGDATSKGDYSLGFFTAGSQTWSNPINAEVHHILNQDPLFVSTTDFHLQGSSPARQAGGPLTTVDAIDSGSGTSLVVVDAHFFQDGWAGVSPDWIAVGNIGNTVQISSINYSTNTITIAAPINRSSGQPVWLYKNSSGTTVLYAARNSAVPDLGAFPYPTPAPATNFKVTKVQ